MPKSPIRLIREKIARREYDMSAHSVEEMAEDNLNIMDVEYAILGGNIVHTQTDDPRGTKYVIEGSATDTYTPVGVVGRFTTTGRYLVITVYVIAEVE